MLWWNTNFYFISVNKNENVQIFNTRLFINNLKCALIWKPVNLYFIVFLKIASLIITNYLKIIIQWYINPPNGLSSYLGSDGQ